MGERLAGLHLLNPTQHFSPVPGTVWACRIGGYQVCEKPRRDSLNQLASFSSNAQWAENGFPSGDDLLRSLLENAYNSRRKVTILLNWPATALTNLLQQNLNLQFFPDFILFPLDVTNQVHLSTDNYLMENLGTGKAPRRYEYPARKTSKARRNQWLAAWHCSSEPVSHRRLSLL